MNIDNNFENQAVKNIEWKQLLSLASLYASIIIGWIAYHNYQPKLLTNYHFEHYSFALTIVQAIILVVTPILAGRIGDRFRFKKGHRLPIISNGISFAAMVFMAVAFTLISNPGEIFKWVLPLLIICWLVAMSIFTSPALSTLELFTPVEKLPRAMAVLTIVSNVVNALEPVIVDIIDFFGAPLTFVAGGLAVFLSGWALRKNSLDLFKSADGRPMAVFTLDTQRSDYLKIFAIGLTFGMTTTLLFNFLPNSFATSLSVWYMLDGKWWLVIALLLSAIISLPISARLTGKNINKIYWYAAEVALVSGLSVLFIGGTVLTLISIIIFIISFTVLSVSSLPLVINNSNYYQKVFCVGIFFSGVALPEGIVESVLKYLQ